MLHEPMSRREIRWGCAWLLLQLFALPGLLSWGNALLPAPLSAAMLNFVFFVLNFGAVAVIFHRWLRPALAQVRERFFSILLTAAQAFLAYQVLTAVMALLPIFRFQNVNDASIAQMTAENYSLMVIGAVFLVPPAEEALYRGLVFGGLYRKRPWVAYLLSTALFCAIHVMGYLGAYSPLLLLLCFLEYIPAGLCLAWAYARSGHLLAPILVHMAVNAIGISAWR